MREPPAVVVVAYGSPELLATSLRALGPGHDVVLVDNGRSEVVARLAEAHAAVYVRPATNLGFAAAVNLGLLRCRPGRDVLLLNPDAALPWQAVTTLQEELARPPRCAAVAPLLRRPDGTAEQTSWPMPGPALPWRGLIGRGGLRATEEHFLSGAVLLLSGEALAEVGPFDERFFLYAEESDWQRRARAAGWGLREVPSALAEHVGGATSDDAGQRERLFHASALLYAEKWFSPWGRVVFRTGSAAAAGRRLLTTDPRRRRQARATLRVYLRPRSGSRPADADTAR